jgi:ureidoglycolate lyase
MIDRALMKFSQEPSTGVRRVHDTTLLEASDANLRGYGCLVDDPNTFPIEIVRSPVDGWREIDENGGDPAEITEGLFEFQWQQGALYATEHVVGDSYLFGWSALPEQASSLSTNPRERALTWRANCQPAGGQLFFPVNGAAFVVPLALPGVDMSPERFVSFWCDGSRGLYLHPNVWHGPVIPLDDEAELLDRHGRAHARVSVDFVKEFGCYLGSPLPMPGVKGTAVEWHPEA